MGFYILVFQDLGGLLVLRVSGLVCWFLAKGFCPHLSKNCSSPPGPTYRWVLKLSWRVLVGFAWKASSPNKSSVDRPNSAKSKIRNPTNISSTEVFQPTGLPQQTIGNPLDSLKVHIDPPEEQSSKMKKPARVVGSLRPSSWVV